MSVIDGWEGHQSVVRKWERGGTLHPLTGISKTTDCLVTKLEIALANGFTAAWYL